MHRRTVATIVLGAIATLVVVVVAAVLVFTQTDWGRERVRGLVLNQFQKIVHGTISIGKIGGNLISGARISNVVITDSSGAPFLKADTVVAGYTLSNFFRKHIDLNDVRLVNPVIVLSRKTGGKWNWDHIFPRDTVKHPGAAPGFGSWVTLHNLVVINGNVTMKSPWAPSDTLTGAKRDSAVKTAMGPLGRVNIVRADTGFQRVSYFRDIFGKLPLLRLEDPNDPLQIIQVASLHMIAQPLKPPSFRVTQVAGTFNVLNDSLYFSGMKATLAASRLSGSGRYNIENNDLRLRLHADTLSTNDLLWIDPSIPHDGTGKLDFALDWVANTSNYQATRASLAVAGATLSGDLGLLVTDTLAFHNTDMRFANLDTRTIQQLFPTIKSPRQGYLTGRMAATGGFGAMHVDGDVAFNDPKSGVSRFVALGTVGASKGVLRASDLHVTLVPFRVALAKAFAPSLPIGGTVTGHATLDGSTATRLNATGDLTHSDVTGPSHVVGSAVYASGGRVPFINASLRLLPLSLATVGKFAPAAGLRGSVTGPVKLTGPMRDLAIDADLTTPDGGAIAARGTMDLAAAVPSYDLVLDAKLFNASVVSGKAPPTSLTANVTARGTGFTPATMNAVATAHVLASRYDSVAVDSATARVAVANGMLTIDTLLLNAPHVYIDALGQFGLTAPHSGTLRYSAAVDSLGALSRFIPGAVDTGAVLPRPAIFAQRMAIARVDSIRLAQATEVERAVSGRRLPRIVVDTPRAIPRNTLSGSVRASGTATGNVHDFDLTGTASGKNIVALGNSISAFTSKYAWKSALTPQSQLSGDLRANTVLAYGFALDTVAVVASYAKPNGRVNLVVHQDSNRVYTVGAEYTLNKARNDVRLDDVRLRFDTTVYASSRPSLIHFGPAGIDVNHLDLRSPIGRGLYVDGTVPTNGPADLRVDITQFNVADLVGLLQSDIPARGLVSVAARLRGSRADPNVTGAFGLERFTYVNRTVPEVHGLLDYNNQTLHTTAEANREGGPPILLARGTVPINLALSGVTASRVPRNRTIDATISADSLPLDLLPQVTDVVTDVGGRAFAKFTVGGTIDSPNVNGRVALWNGTANVKPLGITVTDVAANVRLAHDTVVIDSVVARSGGRVRLAGGIGIKTLAAPSFDLKLNARNALVIDNNMGHLRANANLAVTGPFDDVEINGSARVLGGVLYIPESNGKTLVGAGDPALFSVMDTSVASQRELFPAQSPLLANLGMNVRLAVSRDVFVRSRDANIELYTAGPLLVSIERDKQSIVLDGTLLSDRGEYRFQSRRFQIKQGSATFIGAPGLNPILQVTAEYDVQIPSREAFAIQIIISGTLDNPKIALQSDAQPPISQTDLLSYLAFGQTSTSLLQQEGSGVTTGGGNIVGEGAAFAAKQVSAAALGALTDQISGQATRALGADYFNIAPADVSLGASSFLRGTQVEFGKYIQTRTFLQLQVRPDPASLPRPGFQLTHRFDPRSGYQIEASLEPRYLLTEPTLSRTQTPITTSAFGLFLTRAWRY